jgi:hypothetical protein
MFVFHIHIMYSWFVVHIHIMYSWFVVVASQKVPNMSGLLDLEFGCFSSLKEKVNCAWQDNTTLASGDL